MNLNLANESNNRKTQSPIIQCPLIGSIQKIVVYETTARFYLVGSNNIETRFKIIKIDRMEPKELIISSDNLEYTRREIKDLLRMIDLGNRPKALPKGTSRAVGLKRIYSAFGIVGFVRFLEGYYMILITKRRRVAEIGVHTIYKIEDTALVYIPSNSNQKNFHPHELRYVKTFQNVDLSSNFYFSYSYDLTNSLQHNMTSCKLSQEDLDRVENLKSPEHASPRNTHLDISNASRDVPMYKSSQSFYKKPNQNVRSSVKVDEEANISETSPETDQEIPDKSKGSEDEVEDASDAVVNLLEEDEDGDDDGGSGGKVNSRNGCKESGENRMDGGKLDGSHVLYGNVTDGDCSTNSQNESEPIYLGVRSSPCMKFVWNEYLLKNNTNNLQYDWILHIIHGFIGQSNINVFNKSIYLTLIARRSNKFAGTRFLKRGASYDGSVANEVETEQIVFDASLTALDKIRFTSFIQIRGSIPLQWSQDGSSMVPKPPINLDQSDPYGAVAGRHFNQLLLRFGSPIVALDLVKKKEKRRHESIVSSEFVTSIQYLNQFLPVEHRVKYVGYDMARISKKKNMDVFKKLETIAEYCLQVTAFYQSKPGLFCNQLRPNAKCLEVLASPEESGRRQYGVVRTNCIDCLDRTNTAQYAIGKCALAKQLYSLGVLSNLTLDYDSDCIRMMEHMYEDQGDTLALQYGGSQLVHRIRGYRKVAPWTSSSRDIMQTLSRYYNNTFSDSDKQNAINLFLGKFIPSEGRASIWDLSTDFYLHNWAAVDISKHQKRSYSMWWDPCVLKCLPYAYNDESKGQDGQAIVVKASPNDERVDLNFDHYKPYELTTFDELFIFNMSSSVRDFMPKSSSDYSPFCARQRPGRRQELYGSKHEANPNVSGKDSTGSSTSTGSEGSMSGSEGSDVDWGDDKDEVLKVLGALSSGTEGTQSGACPDGTNKQSTNNVGHNQVDSEDPFKERYGVSLENPSRESLKMYSRYAFFGTATGLNGNSETTDCALNPSNLDPFKPSTILAPAERSMKVYEEYVWRGKAGPGLPSEQSMEIYKTYVDALKHGMNISQRSFDLLRMPELMKVSTGEGCRMATNWMW